MLYWNFISLFLALHQSHTHHRHVLKGHTHCVSCTSCPVWIVASTSGPAVQWDTSWGFSGWMYASFSSLVSASFFTVCCVSSSPGWARVKRNRLPKRLKKPSTGGSGEQGSETGGVMVGGSLSASPWTPSSWSHTPSPSSAPSCSECSSTWIEREKKRGKRSRIRFPAYSLQPVVWIVGIPESTSLALSGCTVPASTANGTKTAACSPPHPSCPSPHQSCPPQC